MEDLYKPGEVARKLGLSVSCIYKKTEHGEIDCIKIGSAVRYSEQHITDFLKKCERKGAGNT